MKKNKIGSVIVGVDFSKFSKTVSRQARVIATALNVPLIFVHVNKAADDRTLNSRNIKKRFSEILISQIKKRYLANDTDTIVIRHGTPYSELISVAEDYKRPLLIVGFRGEHGAVSRFFLGSTAERLALSSSYPVWIHRGNEIKMPRNMLIPCDFSVTRSSRAVEGARLLGLADTDIELHHVFSLPFTPLRADDVALFYKEMKKNNLSELTGLRKKLQR